MKAKHIFMLSAAAFMLAACEDYTEHNFGTPDELWQASQVNTYNITLTDNDYQTIAANADNIALATAADEDGTTLAQLRQVATEHCFFGNIDPKEYLPAILRNLVGTSQYYSMTPGSTITIKYRTGQLVSDAAYVPQTGELTEGGDYLLVVKGEEQPIATSGEGKTYGYLYLAGSSYCPQAATRIDAETIKADEAADGYTYSIEADGDAWLIKNPYGQYLYMKGTYASFNYTEDLGDLGDGEWANWSISYNNADQTYDITNTGNEKVMRFGTSYSSVGAYDPATATDGYLPIQLYKRVEGQVEGIEVSEDEEEITFTLDEEGWNAKGDYLNQELTGGNSLTNADAIFDFTGWSIEYKGSIGELNYVWSYANIYGLKASAFVSNKSTPTEAWIISPAINLKKATQPVFTFQQAQKYAGTPVTDYLKVYVSTDYAGRGSLGSATWIEVTDKVEGEWPDGSSWNFNDMSLDLSNFVGNQNVRIGFCYISTEEVAATWEVKNVVCREAEK